MIEQFMDESCEWDSIYFEIIDQNGEVVKALYDKKKLAQQLSKDEFFDWRSAMSKVDPMLLDYIKRSIRVDKAKSEVTLHNKENIEMNVLQKFRKVTGGRYLLRSDLELGEDEKKIIKREMISNQEVEFSEFLYDIKIFKIYKLDNRDIIAYQIEIFTLNDPKVVYRYNYPMNFSAETHDPHTMIIDVVNIIEHPSEQLEEKDKKKKTGLNKTKDQASSSKVMMDLGGPNAGSNNASADDGQASSVAMSPEA